MKKENLIKLGIGIGLGLTGGVIAFGIGFIKAIDTYNIVIKKDLIDTNAIDTRKIKDKTTMSLIEKIKNMY